MRDVGAVEEFYREALAELDRRPYPTVEGMKTVIRYVSQRNPKVASVKEEEVLDLFWLKKLDAEGAFK